MKNVARSIAQLAGPDRLVYGPERRTVAWTEARAETGQDGAVRFSGHAAVFGIRAWIGPPKWGYWEEIAPAAFAKTITEADIRMLQNHDPNYPLARTTVREGPGSLRLAEDARGLADEAIWIRTSYAADLAEAIRSGVVSQQSFAFLPVREEWSKTEDGADLRILHEVQLFDVSPVTFPAYEETDAAVRSAGLGLLLEAADMPEPDAIALVRALRTHTITPDIAPYLRAAVEALADLASSLGPATATPEDPDELERARKTELIKRQMRALAAASADLERSRKR
jgi:HK97 family phage prohead protease